MKKLLPEYGVWSAMWTRCTNANSKDYKRYGASGVRVCERWHSFEAFLEDMGRRPSPKHSIDRWPNGSGNYEPGNTRWATPEQQRENRKCTIYVTAANGRRLLTDVVKEQGMDINRVRARIRRGWTPDDAVGLGKYIRRNQ